jgi:hypothetical protein
MALPNVRAGGTQEIVGKLIPRVGIARSHRLAGFDAIRKVLTLIDVEHCIFSHHGNDARGLIVRTLVMHLKLLHEIDLGAVLPFADVAAGLDRLLEREVARCPIASIRGWEPATSKPLPFPELEEERKKADKVKQESANTSYPWKSTLQRLRGSSNCGGAQPIRSLSHDEKGSAARRSWPQ